MIVFNQCPISTTYIFPMEIAKDLNSIFLMLRNNRLWQTPSLKLARMFIFMRTNNTTAIQHPIQQRKHSCSRWRRFWDMATFILTAIFKNDGNKWRRIQVIAYLKFESPNTYTHTTIIALHDVFIKIRGYWIWQLFWKMPPPRYDLCFYSTR